MHSTEVGPNNVPAFLTKLWRLVEDSKCDDLICWGPSGTSFIIRNQPQFSRELLPLYFKHSNMASFIRQLNMYGFRKIVNIEQGGLRSDKDDMEFQHQYFLKEHEYLLEHIKRKVPTGKSAGEEVKARADFVNILTDVSQLKGKQESIDAKLTSVRRENETLWREVVKLRQAHNQQQQMVNKLIHFLVALLQRHRGIAVKRKIPLMFDSPREAKAARLLQHYAFDTEKSADLQADSPSSFCGPVIHDITDSVDKDQATSPQGIPIIVEESENFDSVAVIPGSNLLAEATAAACIGPDEDAMLYNPEEVLLSVPIATSGSKKTAAVPSLPDASKSVNHALKVEQDSAQGPFAGNATSPSQGHLNLLFSNLLSTFESSVEPIEEEVDHTNTMDPVLANVVANTLDEADKNMDVAVPDAASFRKNDFADHIEVTQNELESLREILANSSYNISPSALLEVCSDSLLNSFLAEEQLFSNDDPVPGTSTSNQGLTEDKNEIIGTEIIQYNPSLLELAEDDAQFFDVGGDESNDIDTDCSTLFENVEAILSDLNTHAAPESADLATPEPSILTSPTFPTRKRGRPRKTT